MFISKPIPKLTSQFISTFARIVCILITCNVIAFLAQGSYSGISETSIPSDPTPQNPAIVSATGLASCRSITEAVNQSTVSTRIASHQPITADISASAETGDVHMGDLLRPVVAALDGKGGGSDAIAQGGCANVQGLAAVLAQVKEQLEAAARGSE